MKKISLTIFSLIILLGSLSSVAVGQHPDKQKALNVLLRTNRVIGVAHMAVKRGKVYTGDLGKAVRHERYAKKLFNNGEYQKAVRHSLRARTLAAEAIKANKVKPTSDVNITPEETQLAGGTASDKDLDEEVTTNVPEVKEPDLINNNNLDIDVK